MSESELINVPIRLGRREMEFYGRVATAARTDINTVLCVVLALSIASPAAVPKQPARKAAAKK